LSKGRFVWNFKPDCGNAAALAAGQLQQLLWNADPLKIVASENFRRIAQKNLNS
jgi:hypothetical protein